MLKTILRALHGPIYESRADVLVSLIAGVTHKSNTLLDVGCGNGAIGKKLQDSLGIDVLGAEVTPRSDVPIEVCRFDGTTLPFSDGEFHWVLLADVLHHEKEPAVLMRECLRVASEGVIVKDHQREGLFAWTRIAFMDWAANHGYEVPCLYRYFDKREWRTFFNETSATVDYEQTSINLYPPLVNLVFGRRLQLFAVVSTRN